MAGATVAASGVLAGVLVDSDVLIWTLRGHAPAVAKMEGLADWHISAVSYMELALGCRNKAELKAMQKAFKSEGNDVLPITQGISDMACNLVEKYALSHSLHMADALIAATAISHQPFAALVYRQRQTLFRRGGADGSGFQALKAAEAKFSVLTFVQFQECLITST